MQLRNSLRACAALLAMPLAAPAIADQKSKMVLIDSHGFFVRAHLQAGLNLVAERNLYWDLASRFAAAAQFNPDKSWLESYLKPGVSFRYAFAANATIYGKVSAVLSGTYGKNAFDTGNTGRAGLEEAYAGFLLAAPNGLTLDISAGARELKLGTGMIIANGGSNGFERGAIKLGPRKAWEQAVIARFGLRNFKATAFYLRPNELPSSDKDNTLAGFDLRFDGKTDGYAGLTYARVLTSTFPYPKAGANGVLPPTVIANARKDLHVVNVYARTPRLPGLLAGTFATADFAYQRNSRINMRAWAGRLQVGYVLQSHPWRPMLMYGFQTFSGDNPRTSRLERFDPLFYEGSPSSWATGSKSAMTFINSNVNAHQLTFRLNPSRQDIITLRYAHIRVNELRSPIQFGQATRVDGPALVAGATHPHLADDVFIEYTRVVTPNTFLTAGVSASFPGKGIELALGKKAPVWIGGFVNVVVNY